jgi:hypothetical protein
VNFGQIFGMIFEAVLTARLRGGYARGQKSSLSLLKSVVPAGVIEPPSQIDDTELIDFTKR